MKHAFSLFLTLYACTLLTAQSVDSLAIRQVDSLIMVSQNLTSKSDYDKALEVNAAASKIALDYLGRESAAFGNCCRDKGIIFFQKGNYPESEKWYLESREICEQVLSRNHPEYAQILSGLGILYLEMGQLEKAEPLFLEAKAISVNTLGKEHTEYATSLDNLALFYNMTGRFEKAEPILIEAKAIRAKVMGKEHPDYAVSLNNLAGFYYRTGQYEKAEPICIEAAAIRKQDMGKEHPAYAASLSNLALIYSNMGRYDKVEPLNIEAKAIREKSLGKEHPYYAQSLNNLAVLYKNMGHYGKAEPLYIEANAIKQKVLGKEHPDYAGGLENLANLYRSIGQYEKAEPLYIEANAIKQKVLGKEHPDYAGVLNNMAVNYYRQGQYEKAEPLYIEVKVIREKILGKEHPDYARVLDNMGLLYTQLRRFKEAETFSIEAKTIREKVLGKEHPAYAGILNNLAFLYYRTGQYEKAEQLLIEAKSIKEKILGKEHPDYAITLNGLAGLYNKTGQDEEAEPVFFELSATNRDLLEKAMYHLTERELNQYLNLFSTSQDQILLFTHKTKMESLIPICYENSLFYKGFLLQSQNRIHQLANLDPEATETLQQLKGYRRRLAKQYTRPIAKRDSVLVVRLESRANDLERELTRTVAGFGEAVRQATLEEVQSALPQDALALEFVHFGTELPDSSQSIQYAALLLRPGSAQPAYIPLFDESQFNHLLQSDTERKADYVNNLYAWADRGLVRTDPAEKTLHDLIWSKIEAIGLEGINTVYYSPSGVLHRINLGAIPLDARTVLSDRYNLIELNSTRQLALPDKVDRSNRDALLVGGVEFDIEPGQVSTMNDPPVASRSINTAWTESGPRDGTWSSLIWTVNEVENISTTLSSHGFHPILYTGTEATEEVVKAIGTMSPSPRVLHLATHGFFFPDPEARNDGTMLGEEEPVFKASDNPMVRSGLILAGGNHAWEHGRAVSPEREDGILTAYEISQMNLSNTELVVLSACETGLGDIRGEEGVYGLQRAFKIAGAKYLIMSLWQVPDRQTMQFMTTFYRNWMEQKMTIPDAFRKTQLEMRDRFFDAYNWAGFVLVE